MFLYFQQDDPSEIKTLLDKLKQMESKLIDFRNQNSSLKQELRIAQKVMSHCKTMDKGCDKISNCNISLETRCQDCSKGGLYRI